MSDPLAAFLKPLGLIDYLQTFKDEEIHDVSLLKSMGEEMLRESMEELGMSTPHIDKLAKAVFGAMFEWAVDFINVQLCGDAGAEKDGAGNIAAGW